MNAARLRLRFAIAMGLASTACSKEGAQVADAAADGAEVDANANADADAAAKAKGDAEADAQAPAKVPFGIGGSGCGFDVVCQPQPKGQSCASSYTEPKRSVGIEPRTGALYEGAPQKKTGECCYRLPRRFCGGGRPLRDEDGPIVAPLVTRSDWLHAAFARERAGEDTALAERWLREAAFEHASVASFARVTLQLMALGAPPDLVAGAQRAALDEIEHARTFLSLAERRGAMARGPGPLAVDRAPLATSFESFAVDTFLDGCLAETVSGIELRAKADDGDDVERAAIAAIADDEERHAELAWRMLAWAVRRGGDTARAALDDAVATISEDGTIVRDVVLPCVRSLLASERSKARAQLS